MKPLPTPRLVPLREPPARPETEPCFRCGETLPYGTFMCPRCSYDSAQESAARRRLEAASERDALHTAVGGSVNAHGVTVLGDERGIAVPRKRWRGWRERQPKRNPVTVKRVGE